MSWRNKKIYVADPDFLSSLYTYSARVIQGDHCYLTMERLLAQICSACTYFLFSSAWYIIRSMPTSQKMLAINWPLSTMSGGGAEVLEGKRQMMTILAHFRFRLCFYERLSINCDVCTFSTDAPAHSHDSLEFMRYLSVFVLKREHYSCPSRIPDMELGVRRFWVVTQNR